MSKQKRTMSLTTLMISPQFRPIVGGYERAAERLSVALTKLGVKVVVITEKRDDHWPAVEQIEGYEIRRLPCLYRRHLHAITSLLSFAGFLLRYGHSFDVWHVHQYGPHAALAIVFGKLLRRPVVLKLTSSASMGISQALGSGIFGRLLAVLHRQVDMCLAVSEETRVEASQFGIAEQRIYLAPNGVDGYQFHPVSTQERRTAQRILGLECQRLVLFVGRLSPEKNPLGLLDAWAAIDHSMHSDAMLALVGDGPEEKQIRSKIKALDLEGTVYLAGQRTDVAIWYRAADIYVIASHNEGLSNSMVEALASGLPVISTSVSGASEYIQTTNAGYVVPIDDMPALADAIQNLLSSPEEITRFSLNARQVFEEHFSIITVAGRLNALYSILRRKH